MCPTRMVLSRVGSGTALQTIYPFLVRAIGNPKGISFGYVDILHKTVAQRGFTSLAEFCGLLKCTDGSREPDTLQLGALIWVRPSGRGFLVRDCPEPSSHRSPKPQAVPPFDFGKPLTAIPIDLLIGAP